jgi:dihydroxyacetone kinase
VLRALSSTVRRVMGGTSGPLYAVMLLRAAAEIEKAHGVPSVSDWSHALSAASMGVTELGGAHLGDRTMVDALEPAASALREALDAAQPPDVALATAVAAARNGAQATAAMQPKRGRSSYVGDRALGFVDPGAYAIGLWMEAIQGALKA